MQLDDAAKQLAECLRSCDVRVVFAESCTAGLVSASLAKVPGISAWLCGSAVVYREATKTDWLGVSPADLEKFSAVSEPVARAMANGVLERTAEAQASASVTGHFGPGAPEGLDGVVYVSVAARGRDDRVVNLGAWRQHLTSLVRAKRQEEAAALVLVHLQQALCDSPWEGF